MILTHDAEVTTALDVRDGYLGAVGPDVEVPSKEDCIA